MSSTNIDWFDGCLVEVEAIAGLSHRVRVAWLWYQFETTMARISRYFYEKSGGLRAALLARDFWEYGRIDPVRIAEAMVATDGRENLLDEEQGYHRDTLMAATMLLGSVIDPDPQPAVEGNPLCRFPIDPMIVHRSEAYAQIVECASHCASYLAMVFAYIQIWRQGINDSGELDDKYFDDQMKTFLRFSQATFAVARTLSDENLSKDSFSSVSLNWEIHPVPHKIRERITSLPPIHERPGVIQLSNAGTECGALIYGGPPSGCMFNLHPCQGILALGVLQDARKSHVPVRFDLFGQIDSSVSG